MTNHDQADTGMTSAELRDFVRRFFEMANAHDFDRMTDFLHEEVLVNGMAVARADVIAQFHGYAAAVPDLTWQIEDLVIENDQAAVRLTDAGTPVTNWLGLEPTGRSVSFTETAFYRFQAGRLKAMTFLVDMDAARR
jgi:predicted ester cyclase